MAVVFAKRKDFVFRRRAYKIGDDQAYIYNLYTFEAHRGKNLAPYLRFQLYKTLEEKGIKEIFSITSYFNKSSLRSNKKLRIRRESLNLYVGLFKKYHWNYVLKTYEFKESGLDSTN